MGRFSPPGSRLLDDGCGIGSDGLRLIELGYDVDFADFDNPSTRYLRWRLERRGLPSRVYDIDTDSIDAGYHLAYAFDVIEHAGDPFAFLERMESAADLVAVNFLDDTNHHDEAHEGLHHDLPIAELLDHATRRGLLRYRVYHGRSHFVIYRSGRARPPKPTDQVRSQWRRRLGAPLSGPKPWRLPGSPGGAAWLGSPRG